MKTRSPNETIPVKHACGHTVTCPREFMPPGRQREEEARDCAACRLKRRWAAMDKNIERGLKPFVPRDGVSDRQCKLAEEIRDRWIDEYHPGGPIQAVADLRLTSREEYLDPLWWITNYADRDQRAEHAGRALENSPEESISREMTAAPILPVEPPPLPSNPFEMTPEQICAATGIPDKLLPKAPFESDAQMAGKATAKYSALVADPVRIEEIPLSAIAPSPLNPRSDLGDLSELAESIRQHGILQPLVVRHRGGIKEPISLLAGHRRLAAARLAGLATVPCVIRKAKDDAEALSLMLVENLQREDLDLIEQAQALAKLAELGHKQTAIAQQIGKSQPWVANAIRLTRLPESVKERIRTGELSPAHGRALLKWEEAPAVVEAIAERAVLQHWDSKTLERENLPMGWNLQQAGLVRQVNHETLFEWEQVCPGCSFGCFRVWDNSENGGWCLKPEHYDQLQQEEISRRNAAYLAQREQEHAEEGAKGGEVALPGTMMEAYAREDPLSTIPAAPEFSWSTMEACSGEYGRSPTGCDEHCPCRGVAQKNGVLVDVCLDKKRRAMLQMMDTKRANKEGRQKLKALQQRAEAFTVNGPEETTRVLGWIAAHTVGSLQAQAVPAALKALGIDAPAISERRTFERGQLYEAFAAIGPGQLIQLMALALMEHEIGQQLGYQTWSAPATEWLLGKETSQ